MALSEVQGYVYAARHHAAELARALGDRARARALQKDAESLHRKFEREFWCEDLGLYALALDGRKRRCEVVSSNAGQCLLSGIATPAHARRVAEVMASPEVFSGWGIRTIGTDERRYNPMSYHNGSVWPHDTALVAAGLARYGLKDLVLAVTMGLLDATRHLEQHRLPELFCGFPRRVRGRAYSLPHRVRAAGLGVGVGLPADPVAAGTRNRCARAAHRLSIPAPARIDRVAAAHRVVRRYCAARPAVRTARR